MTSAELAATDRVPTDTPRRGDVPSLLDAGAGARAAAAAALSALLWRAVAWASHGAG